MKIKTAQTTSNLTNWEDLRRYISIQVDDILAALNGRLSFGDNIQSKLIGTTFSASGSVSELVHNLGYIPNGYILVGSDQAITVYDGGQNTTSNLYLKASGATFPASARVMIF